MIKLLWIIYMIVLLGLYWLCKSLNPPLHTVSFVVHLEVGHKLPVGLGQDIATHSKVFACDGEGGCALVQLQLQLHLQLCPCPKLKTCWFFLQFSIVGVNNETNTAHCITWVRRGVFVFLSVSVDHSNYDSPMFCLGDGGDKDKRSCPWQNLP